MKQKINSKGVRLIKYFESIHDGDLTTIGLQPKMDCSDIWTEGWGHAIFYKGKLLKGSKNKDLAYRLAAIRDPLVDDLIEADELFKEDLTPRERLVRRNLKVPVNDNQFSALVSHVFNCGVSETLFKLINKGDLNSEDIKIWWTTKYITSGGELRGGLVKRRKIEYELFSTGQLNIN